MTLWQIVAACTGQPQAELIAAGEMQEMEPLHMEEKSVEEDDGDSEMLDVTQKGTRVWAHQNVTKFKGEVNFPKTPWCATTRRAAGGKATLRNYEHVVARRFIDKNFLQPLADAYTERGEGDEVRSALVPGKRSAHRPV